MPKLKNALSIAGKAGVIAVLAAGVVGSAVQAASAAGSRGNDINNCYGMYWNTAWSQKCDPAGATLTGYYHSTGWCSNQADTTIRKWRVLGNTTEYGGNECMFSVDGVYTTYSAS